MLRNSDGESEILLGNKQLLGIFFVIALLLGVAFAGGYVVGHGPSRKTDTVASDTGSSTAQTGTAGETHALPADPSASTAASATKDGSAGTGSVTSKTPSPEQRSDTRQSYQPPSGEDAERPLGSKRPAPGKAKAGASTEETGTERAGALLDYTPQSGQTFLQVAAVSRDEAAAIADVLHKKGFHAHAVPKPGNTKIYRILIGPIHSAADLSSTRESLRNKMGFREVIVQRY